MYKTEIDANKLIEKFTDMSNKDTLLIGKNVTREDLLIQIIGTIIKLCMDNNADMDSR